MYTVHIREKPARPFVALGLCAILLAGLTYGAWRFSLHRTDAVLGPELSAPGWPLAFRLAEAWRQVNVGAGDADQQLIYWKDEPRGMPSKLIIRRMPVGKHSAARQCEQSLREYFGAFGVAGRRYDEAMDVAPGQLQGSFLVVPEQGYAVFVGNWRSPAVSEEWWVIELAAAPPLWPADVQFFRRILESCRPL